MKKTILIAICVLLSGVCKAQLVYQNNHLTFNGTQFNNSYSTTWTGWAHAWVDGTNSNRYLTFVMSNEDPRIGSGSGNIAFYSNTEGYHKIQVGEVYNASDINFKSNIQSLDNATATVMQLRPVTYNLNPANARSAESKNFGFIAQEVENVLPTIVIEDDATIQELTERVAQLELQLSELSN
ncbi:MAG: tail fiber domain-containing protein [Bacteroidales bacterium]|nr:tail fiber domain-containing protein [Bacteroidales bacterium]